MIIKDKECPFEKRVPFVAIVPKGHRFGTLFSLSAGYCSYSIVPGLRLVPFSVSAKYKTESSTPGC